MVMTMNLQWLHTFQTVVDDRSYTRAAERLFLSQPAASKQIRHLEQAFGASLICQVGHELVLTGEGREVYELAVRLRRDIDCTQMRIKDMAEVDNHSVTIVGGPAMLSHYLPHFLRDHWSLYEDIAVRTETLMNPLERTEAVRRGDADLAFQTLPFLAPDLECRPCFDDRIVAVCSASRDFPGDGEVEMRAILQERVALLPRTTDGRQLVDEWMAEHAMRPARIVQLSTIEEIRAAAQADLAIGFLSQGFVRDALHAGSLKQVRIHGFAIRRPVFVVHRAGVRPAALALAKQMQQQLARVLGAA